METQFTFLLISFICLVVCLVILYFFDKSKSIKLVDDAELMERGEQEAPKIFKKFVVIFVLLVCFLILVIKYCNSEIQF